MHIFRKRCKEPDARRAFTLVELLVVMAIIGILVSMLLPALSAVREAGRRTKCRNNMKQLALAMQAYHEANGHLPHGARTWVGDSYGGPGQFYDDHGWYSMMGPFIDEESWADMIDYSVSFSHVNNDAARRHKMSLFACPSDGPLAQNEWHRDTWARLRGNYVVNWGNTNYGQTDRGSVEFGGAPFQPRHGVAFANIRDGLTNTLMISECIKITYDGPLWASPLSDFTTSLGGQTFNTWLTPNSKAGDDIARVNLNTPTYLPHLNGIPVPNFLGGADVATTLEQSFVARSKHNHGVVASMCDGSVQYVNNSIDLAVWRALSTARGEEPVDLSAL
ncbi:MAG: DUF1559 domain-containing protein [Pirellulales bacterium]|nr:DUF1559 domain-containing protein [Pirellulales bacterium]